MRTPDNHLADKLKHENFLNLSRLQLILIRAAMLVPGIRGAVLQIIKNVEEQAELNHSTARLSAEPEKTKGEHKPRYEWVVPQEALQVRVSASRPTGEFIENGPFNFPVSQERLLNEQQDMILLKAIRSLLGISWKPGEDVGSFVRRISANITAIRKEVNSFKFFVGDELRFLNDLGVLANEIANVIAKSGERRYSEGYGRGAREVHIPAKTPGEVQQELAKLLQAYFGFTYLREVDAQSEGVSQFPSQSQTPETTEERYSPSTPTLPDPFVQRRENRNHSRRR